MGPIVPMSAVVRTAPSATPKMGRVSAHLALMVPLVLKVSLIFRLKEKLLVCPKGRFGNECMQLCNCQNAATCNAVNGECQCQAGFHGKHCELPCEKGTYGLDCQETCNCDNMECDPVDGSCICPIGYRGKGCNQGNHVLAPIMQIPECEHGTFGAGCRGTCLCKNNATCNHITGACECGSGWRGQYCDRPCPDGFFGHKCRSVCSCTSSGKFLRE